jgi:hypothetical protein
MTATVFTAYGMTASKDNRPSIQCLQRSAELFARVIEDPAGDNQAIDLPGAFEDIVDLGIPEPLL